MQITMRKLLHSIGTKTLGPVILCVLVGCAGSPSDKSDGGIDGGAPVDSGVDAGGCEHGDPCGPFGDCCQAAETCVNDWQCLPQCDTTRCGENLQDCCDADEICLDGVICAADCESDQELCGEALDICCPGGAVCLDATCVLPQGGCDNNYDCPDESWYCEPTLGACLPLVAGPVCEGQSTFTAIEPVREWYWPGIDWNGHFYQHVVATPSVGDVSGDGIPDVVVVAYWTGLATDTDTVVVVLSGEGDGMGGGLPIRTIPNDPSGPRAYGRGNVALGNFDGDPALEMVYQLAGGGVRIVDDNGITEVCDTVNYPGCSGIRHVSEVGSEPWPGALSLADLDHDGTPDVVYRCQAFNGHDIGDSSLDFTFARPDCGKTTVVADLDEDGRFEIIDGAHAITVDPSVQGGVDFWTTPNNVPPGHVAVADILPGIPGPEVISINRGLYLLDGQTGAVLVGPGGTVLDASIVIPGDGIGGAPIVADFDGDGLPEIGTAGLAAYVVYDPDCWNPPLRSGGQCASGSTNLVLWTTPTQDLSSSQTGSSVFDFQGDGIAEVLYNDECFLHIFNGSTGESATATPIPSSSRTAMEYPLVADVDGDGNSEIVAISTEGGDCAVAWKDAGVSIDLLCKLTECLEGPACPIGQCLDMMGHEMPGYQCDSHARCQLPGYTHGVRVFGDAHDRWVRTRPVWNQFSYHVTNFTYSFGVWNVPVNEVPSWTTVNNYRQNVQGGALFPVPDLQVTLEGTVECPSLAHLVATVSNQGSAGVAAGVEVSVYRTDSGALDPPELVTTLTTSKALLPGAWERLSAIYPVPSMDVEMTFEATVDPEAEIEECHEDNNGFDGVSLECRAVQ